MSPSRWEGPARRIAHLIAAALLVGGVAVILYPFSTDLRYDAAQWLMRQRVASQAVAQDAAGGEPLPAGAVAHLVIPAIGVDAYVVEGTDTQALAQGPGHYPDTPLPGEGGNCAIAGHRTMYGAVFNELDLLQPGDQIVVHTETCSLVYSVESIEAVDPSCVEVVAPTEEARLTLTTCHPEGSARQRLVVAARLAE